jgi:hypothetical protein
LLSDTNRAVTLDSVAFVIKFSIIIINMISVAAVLIKHLTLYFSNQMKAIGNAESKLMLVLSRLVCPQY